MTSLINRCLVLIICSLSLIDLCFACLTLNDYICFSRLPQSNVLHVDGHPFPCINIRYFHLRWWPPHMSVFLHGIGGSFHQKASVFFFCCPLQKSRYGCFLKWWYPQITPKMIICRRKTHGFVVETHHFRVHHHIVLNTPMVFENLSGKPPDEYQQLGCEVLCLAVAVAYAVLIMVQLPGGEVLF